jgi:hypothetical protein
VTRRQIDGDLYVAHFDPPYRHAGHYLGWTEDPAGRWGTHLNGHGSPLVRAAVGAGCRITFHVIGRGTRYDERRLHNEHHTERHCPTCRQVQAA